MKGGEVLTKEGYRYEFIVKGHISKHYFKKLDELDFKLLKEGTTKLSGIVVDQAKLYSIISKFRDLGLEILMLKREGDQK